MSTAVYPDVGGLTLSTVIDVPFATAKIKLFQTAVVPTRDTIKTDLTEANFTGYTAKTLTAVGTPFLNVAGGIDTPIPSQEFVVTTATPVVGNDIYGYWIENAAGDLLLVVAFDNPVQMQVVGNALVLLILLNFFAVDAVNSTVNGLPA
jgi:hypothetical protein